MTLGWFTLETMLKRVVRYLLKRYLGRYFENFSQDELSYGMTHGKGSIENVRLNVEALNELGEEYHLPFEFLHGSIDFVSMLVPWSALLSANVVFEFRGLKLTVQPKERPEDVSMFDSMWASTSSLQLAEECLKSKVDDEEEKIDAYYRSDGLEKIAQTIEAVIANMKARFYDSVLRIEHVVGNGSSGVAMEIKIANAEYYDEAGVNAPCENNRCNADKHTFESQAYSFKNVIFEGISLYTAEFMTQSRTQPPPKQGFPSDYVDPSQFVPGSPEMPPTHSSLPVKKSEPEVQNDPVLISKFTGQQKLRLQLKQNEAVIGPKVDVEFNLGAFNLFLTPQQVHMLYELMSGFIKPSGYFGQSPVSEGSNDHPCERGSHSIANKPMKAADYALVEQELLRQQSKIDMPSKSLKNQRGWSSHSLDESDEEFHLMTMENRISPELENSTLNDNDSFCSSISSDARSDYAYNTLGASQRTSKARSSSVQAMLQDHMTELTHFRGCCSSVCIIILHDDSVQESLSNNAQELDLKNTLSLKDRAATFFNDLLTLQMSGFDFKDFEMAKDPLSKLCETNHLRLMASSVAIDGNEKSSSAQCILNFSLSLFQLEVLECLFDSENVVHKSQIPTYVQILSCENKLNCQDSSGLELQEACFKLKYQQVECTSQNSIIKLPPNKLDIQIGPTKCEVDISLTDRIRTLLKFPSFFSQVDSKNNEWRDCDVGINTRVSPKTEISISSPNLMINLRFPIPDLRSVHDMERVPWWQQNLHKEILVMVMKDVTFATTVDGDLFQTKYEIQCRDFHGLFALSETEKPISFLRVSVDPDVDEVSRENGFDWPRLVITKVTKLSTGDLESALDDHEEVCAYSLSDVLMSNLDIEPSPFCSTSVADGSKLYSRNKNMEENKKNSDHDEIVKPASKETILNFLEQIVNKSEYLLEFTLPTVNMVLHDKEFFELLSNRLCSDLLLWENASLAPAATYDPNRFKVHAPGLDLDVHMTKDSAYDQYPVFKPFSNDSNSESDEEEAAYCSVFEYCQRQQQKHKRKTNDDMFTKISISLAIAKGMLTVNTPALDAANKIMPEYCGKLQLHVEDGQLFIASSYKGDPNESYLCFLAEKSSLYHKGAVLQDVDIPVVESFSSTMQNNLNHIIYESEPGMLLKSNCDNQNIRDMLKVAVHTVRNPKQQIKTFKVAMDISAATLRHHTYPVQQLWINQFIDFLKINDYPINGYVPPAIVTELHINLSNCAIDYRPLKLPLRTAITVDNFNMSCNVTATTPSFLFRIISEEMRLFISNYVAAKKVELQKNYVCVIDTGLIDISFRTNVDEKNDPKLEMCATNDKVHIRTCADSFKALMELMVYLSNNGDMDIFTPEENEVIQDIKELNKSINTETETKDVHLLMAEAMKECSQAKISDKKNGKKNQKPNVQESDLYCTDDEFCILEDDPGVGLMPRNGEPQIRMLTDEPIKIVDNHFAIPPGKSDVLKAPKHFPKPLVLFALREMSLVWHLYGGSDFKSSPGKKKRNAKKVSHSVDNGVTFSDEKSIDVDTYKTSVSFCKVTPLTKTFDVNAVHFSMEHVTINENKNSGLETWLCKGGPERNHNVLMELHLNKVQFQREIYPLDNEYASRYILLIHDIEIRDRLASSQINKFLYQYSNKTMPRQSHSNMIDIKAVYTRPDPKRSSASYSNSDVECSLKVSCNPLRLNVDQDALMFLIEFFQEVLEIFPEDSSEGESESGAVNVCVKTSNTCTNQVSNLSAGNQNIKTSETFYRFFSFSPEVLIRIDYQGKRVVMEQGALRGLLMGLGQLNSSEIKLKSICYRHGLLGLHKILSFATNEWQQDIIKNQLPSLLGGVGPMHSFVQLFQGIKDLFYLPVMQYRRDGQIVRGLQHGASSFSTSTAMAFLDLTSRLVGAIQGCAEIAYDMVSPGPSVAYKYLTSTESCRHGNQPADIREGVATAYHVVKEGLGDTARTIYHVAATEHEHKGVPGAVGGVLRQIPPSLFTPVILAGKATRSVLDGMLHQLVPDAHQEDIHKWRTKKS